MKVEPAVLGSPSLISLMASVDIKQHGINPTDSPMSDDHHLVSLDDLLHEEGLKLQIASGRLPLHGIEKDLVVGLGQLETGEQVRDDAVEERDVVRQELGHVDVDDGAQQLRRESMLLGGQQGGDVRSSVVQHLARAGIAQWLDRRTRD